MLRLGIENPGEVLDFKAIVDLVGAALPHRVEYLREHGPSAQVHLVDVLEEAILQELRRVLTAADDDVKAVQRAAAILAEVERVSLKLAEARKAEQRPRA